jgi:hypothetical protein
MNAVAPTGRHRIARRSFSYAIPAGLENSIGPRLYKYVSPDGENIRQGRNYSHAFSLVEVMVAVGLLAVIIVGLLAMFYQTQRAFRVGMTQVDVLEKGRATMELLARTLQECSASIEAPITNFRITVPPQYSAPMVQWPGGGSPNTIIQDVSFVRRFGDDWIGESYQVSNAPMAGVGTLYRLLFVTNHNGIGPVSETIHNIQISDAAKGNTNFAPVADGIVHFRIMPLDKEGLRYPIPTNGPSMYVPNINTYWFRNNGLPGYFEIELAILEPKSFEQFRARYAVDRQKANAYLESQGGRMHFFKQRIPVRSGPRVFSVTNELVP